MQREWEWIARGVLRVLRGPAAARADATTRVLRDGRVEYESRGFGHPWHLTVEWIGAGATLPDAIDSGGARLLSEILLIAPLEPLLSASSAMCALARAARKWRSDLRLQYDDIGQLVRFVQNASDDFAALMRSADVLRATRYDARVDLAGMAALRRLQPFACSRPADWRAAVVADCGVRRFLVAPVTATRFAHLYALGVLATAHGHPVQAGDAVVVPRDAGGSCLTLAIASLMSCDVCIDDAWPERIFLPFRGLHAEPSASTSPDEALRAYRVHMEADGVLLTIDEADCAVRSSREAVAVDDVRADEVPRDPIVRARHDLVRRAFPALARRLAARGDRCDGREAQARRLSHEWTLEGFDAGTNLSSLGMSVLLAVCWGWWWGARVRVCVGRARAACVLVHGLALVDPARTLLNAFDVAVDPILLPPTGDRRVMPARGDLVEVRARRRWHLGQVVRVRPHMNLARVRFVVSRREAEIDVRSHAWRALRPPADADCEGDEDDLCEAVRTLLSRCRRPPICDRSCS